MRRRGGPPEKREGDPRHDVGQCAREDEGSPLEVDESREDVLEIEEEFVLNSFVFDQRAAVLGDETKRLLGTIASSRGRRFAEKSFRRRVALHAAIGLQKRHAQCKQR